VEKNWKVRKQVELSTETIGILQGGGGRNRYTFTPDRSMKGSRSLQRKGLKMEIATDSDSNE